MSEPVVGPQYPATARALRLGIDDRGSGWVVFAATMLILLGAVNIVEGVAAIGNSYFFAPRAHYLFGDLEGWGWVVLANGAVQSLAGIGIFAHNDSARWLGVFLAAVNAMVQMLFMPAYPLWSLSLFAVDLLVIYALVAYGGISFRPA